MKDIWQRALACEGLGDGIYTLSVVRQLTLTKLELSIDIFRCGPGLPPPELLRDAAFEPDWSPPAEGDDCNGTLAILFWLFFCFRHFWLN